MTPICGSKAGRPDMAKTYFFWDPLSDNILQERDETGTVTAEYTTEPGLYGNVISQNRGGAERQYHFDALGSTLALTDDNQQVTDTRAYTAFGESSESTGNTVFPFQYVGQKGYYRDDFTGEYVVRRRVYQPQLARWRSKDPLTLISREYYVYCTNRTTSLTDPTGMRPPPRPLPRSPRSPGVVHEVDRCSEGYSKDIIYREKRAGSQTWEELFLLNVRATGYPGAERTCKEERTHRIAVTMFQTIPAGAIAAGFPVADTQHELGEEYLDRIRVISTCVELDRKKEFNPGGPGGAGAGWFVDLTFHCFSPCSKCKCLPERNTVDIHFGDILVPFYHIRVRYTPLDLRPPCFYDDCSIDLYARQQ